jgi:hypothetical protein
MPDLFSSSGKALNFFLIIVPILIFFLILFYSIKKKNKKKENSLPAKDYTSLRKTLHLSAFDPGKITDLFRPYLTESGREIFKRMKLVIGEYEKLMTENYIKVQDEIDFLKNFLEIERLRMKGKFYYSIKYSGNSELNVKIPSMMLLPLVSNLIKQNILTETLLEIEFNRMLNKDLKILVRYLWLENTETESDQQLKYIIANIKEMLLIYDSEEKFSIKQYLLESPEKGNYGISVEIVIPSDIVINSEETFIESQ